MAGAGRLLLCYCVVVGVVFVGWVSAGGGPGGEHGGWHHGGDDGDRHQVVSSPEECPVGESDPETRECVSLREETYWCWIRKCCSDVTDDDNDDEENDVGEGAESEVSDETGGRCRRWAGGGGHHGGGRGGRRHGVCTVRRKCTRYVCSKDCCEGYLRGDDGKCYNENEVTCQNGGTVVVDRGYIYCWCGWTFHGPWCEIPVCRRRCRNGGRCVAKDGEAVCECPDGYLGRRRQYLPVCRRRCRNGGRCVAKDGEAVCECLGSYYGRRCQYYRQPTTTSETTRLHTTKAPTTLRPTTQALTTLPPTTRAPKPTVPLSTKAPTTTIRHTTQTTKTTTRPTTQTTKTTTRPTTQTTKTTMRPTIKTTKTTMRPTTKAPRTTMLPTTKAPTTTMPPTTKAPPTTMRPTTKAPSTTTLWPTTKLRPTTTLRPTTKAPPTTPLRPTTTLRPTTKAPPTTMRPTTKAPTTTHTPGPPVIWCPPGIMLEHPPGQSFVTITQMNTYVKAHSSDGHPLEVSFSRDYVYANRSSVTVVATATDQYGRSASCSFDMVVSGVQDTQPPVLKCPDDKYFSVGEPVTWELKELSDDVGITDHYCIPYGIYGSRSLAIGGHLVDCYAVDGVGKTTHCSFTIHVEEAPRASAGIIGHDGPDGEQVQNKNYALIMVGPIIAGLVILAFVVGLWCCFKFRKSDSSPEVLKATGAYPKVRKTKEIPKAHKSKEAGQKKHAPPPSFHHSYDNHIYNLPYVYKHESPPPSYSSRTGPPTLVRTGPPSHVGGGTRDLREVEYAYFSPPTYAESMYGKAPSYVSSGYDSIKTVNTVRSSRSNKSSRSSSVA